MADSIIYLVVTTMFFVVFLIMLYMKISTDYGNITITEGSAGAKFKNGKFDKILGVGSYSFLLKKEEVWYLSTEVFNRFHQDNLYTTKDGKMINIKIILKLQIPDIQNFITLNRSKSYDYLVVDSILIEEVNKITQEINFTDLIKNYSLLNEPLLDILRHYFPSKTGYDILEIQSIAVKNSNGEEYEEYYKDDEY